MRKTIFLIEESYCCKRWKSVTIIPVDDVIYIEAYDDYVKVHIQEWLLS